MPLAENRYVALGLAGMAAIMLVPLLSVVIPPLTDLPNHVSRLHILAHIASDPDLQRNYVESWGVIPNLAIDVIGLPLAKAFSPYVAGKLFAILAFLTGLFGMVALQLAVHRKVNAWTGIIFFAAYNQCVMYGLLNFYFGIGLGFLLLAAWVRYGGEHGHIRFWLLPLGALAIYFSHLFAFGLYGLIFTAHALSHYLRTRSHGVFPVLRRVAGLGAQFVVPVPLFLFTGRSGTQLDGPTEFGSSLQKIMALLAAFRVYVEPIDLISILFVFSVLVIAFWRRNVRIGENFSLPLLVLAVLAIVTPRAVFGLFGIDQRFAIVAVMLFLAVARIELPLRGPFAILLVAGAGLLIWRAAALTEDWRKFDAQFAELRNASRVMDRGASVLTVQRQTGEKPRGVPLGSSATYWHVVSLTVVERALFNPLTFTARHQPIAAHPDRRRMDCDACRPLTLEALRVTANPEISWETLELPYESPFFYRFAAQWPDRFDYVLIIDFGMHENPLPELLVPRYTGSYFAIYENRQRPRP